MKKKFFLESGNKIMLLAAEFCFFFWNSGFYVIYKLPRLQKKYIAKPNAILRPFQYCHFVPDHHFSWILEFWNNTFDGTSD